MLRARARPAIPPTLAIPGPNSATPGCQPMPDPEFFSVKNIYKLVPIFRGNVNTNDYGCCSLNAGYPAKIVNGQCVDVTNQPIEKVGAQRLIIRA
eukprot:tig00020805_g13997.t1